MTLSAPARKLGPSPVAGTLVPLRQALADLLGGLAPVDAVATALTEAEGAVLAEPLRVAAAIPAVSVALRPGYAVCASDTFGASPYSPILLPNAVRQVAAGEALPPGADAVLEAESVLVRGGRAEVTEAAAPGRWVRRAGEDAASGAALREAGERLRVLDLAASAASGIARAQVRRPRLLVAETLTGPAAESCAALVARLAEKHGAKVLRRAAGELDAEPADVMVAIGDPAGLRATLPGAATIVADQLALRPGEDAVLARIGATPILFVPPRLDAALALMLAVIRPVLDHLAAATPEPAALPAPLARKIVSTIGLTEIALLRRSAAGWDPVATGDLPLAAIAAADAWLALEPGQEGYPAGHAVAARPL